MAKVIVIHDREGDTLTVWFGDPAEEDASAEEQDGLILMRDAGGRVIGVEKLEFSRSDGSPTSVAFESIVR